MSEKPKVKLTNEDGNAFAILARVRKALRENGMFDKIEEFTLNETSFFLLQLVI